MKIAVVGTHGSGKTTLSYLITAEAKKLGHNAKIINETARNCPFPLNDGFTLNGAHWIVTSQINKELTAEAVKTETIICDRSAIDPIMYIATKILDQDKYKELKKYAHKWMETYDKIIWVRPDSGNIKNDRVRSTDKTFQKNVDENFENYFQSYNLKLNYLCVFSSEIFDSKLDKIMEYIFK